jgi:hypothetical protein
MKMIPIPLQKIYYMGLYDDFVVCVLLTEVLVHIALAIDMISAHGKTAMPIFRMLGLLKCLP